MATQALGTSPNTSSVPYASMGSSQPLDDKTAAVFQAQPKAPSVPQEHKGDPSSSLTEANRSFANGELAFKQKNYYTAYLHYLQAKSSYERLPNDNAAAKKLISVQYHLAWTAMLIRQERRQIVGDCIPTILCPFFWPFTAICCCRLKCCSNWIENETFQGYIDTGIDLLNKFIANLQQKNGISVSTDKNSVSDQTRKELGWAYRQKAQFYWINDTVVPANCAMQENGEQCFSDCCFNNTNGNTNASRHDDATRLANLKLAKEWDPSETEYEAAYQKLSTHMKRPIIHETITYQIS